jgi:hypothetical protein
MRAIRASITASRVSDFCRLCQIILNFRAFPTNTSKPSVSAIWLTHLECVPVSIATTAPRYRLKNLVVVARLLSIASSVIIFPALSKMHT